MDLAWTDPDEFLEGSRGESVIYFKNSILDLSTLSTQELLFLLLLHPGASKSLKHHGSRLSRSRGVLRGVARGVCDLFEKFHSGFEYSGYSGTTFSLVIPPWCLYAQGFLHAS